MLFQELNLQVGQKARCNAGYPHLCTIIIECIKDFGNPKPWSKEWDHIVDNPYDYIKVIDNGRFGALTSHYISSNWRKINE